MLRDYFHILLHICLDMAPWLLAGFAIAFLCSFFMTESRMRRHLGGPGWMPIVKASVFGLPLPLCSCGVLPVALALRRSGARKSAVCAFMASTPQSGADAVPLTWSMLGPVVTLLRFLCAVLSGLVCGALVRWFGHAEPPLHETEDLNDGCAALCGCHHHDHDHPHAGGEHHHHEYVSRGERVRDALRYAFLHLPCEIFLPMVIGVLAAAALELFIPEHLFEGMPRILAYIVAALIGIPAYACSVAIVPVAAGLIAGGISPGTVLVFLACAPTTHVGSLLIVGQSLGWRTVFLFVLGVILVAFGIAAVTDLWLQPYLCVPPVVHAHCHEHHIGGFIVLIPTLLILVNGWLFSLFASRHHDGC